MKQWASVTLTTQELTDQLTPEHYRLLALVCGYDRASWKRRLMIHVAAYADETYLDDGYILMGGYVASVDGWCKLVTPWKNVLAEHPAVPHFSNHGFKSAKWCAKNGVSLTDMHLLQAKKVRLAHAVVEANIFFPAHSRMWRSHFDSVILDHVRALKNPKYELLRDPYYFCYSRFVSLLLQRLPEFNSCLPEDEKLSLLDVYVDENGKLAENASKLFLWMKKNADQERASLMGAAAPLDDKVTVPLQCADLYMGQLREYYTSGVVTDVMEILMGRTFRPPFVEVSLDWTKDALEKFAKRLDSLPPEHWLR